MSLTHLENAFAFYASYHNNKANQLIHIVCVWPILITAQVFFTYTPQLLADYPTSNWSLVVSAVYILYYLSIEQPLAGPLAALMVLGGYFLANTWHASDPECWKLALGIHVFCWVAQIFGHQHYEKRAPAFLDNLMQALFMAPLFVLLEVMFQFGYKPEFHKKAFALAMKNIAEFRSGHPKGK